MVKTKLKMSHLFGLHAKMVLFSLHESAYAKMVLKMKLNKLPTGMQDMGMD